jgi:NTP pyrophosphatase (non-canonical NTP hydrolase)
MKFDDYQKKASETMLPSADNIYYVTLGLVNEAGEVAGKVKKWIRDQDADFAKLDNEALADELGDVLWYLAMTASKMGTNLDDIAQRNIDKLSSRAERGKLTGSGDNR